MKAQILPLPLLKEEVFSEFERDFLVKNNQVFLIKKYGPITYYTVVENDPKFFKKLLKIWERCEYSSSQIPFLPKERDWKWVKKNTHSVNLHYTNKCNSDCNICYAKDSLPFEEISFNEIKKYLLALVKTKELYSLAGNRLSEKIYLKLLASLKNLETFQ